MASIKTYIYNFNCIRRISSIRISEQGLSPTPFIRHRRPLNGFTSSCTARLHLTQGVQVRPRVCGDAAIPANVPIPRRWTALLPVCIG